jgi:23S rRNA pseudouridine2605 synthase
VIYNKPAGVLSTARDDRGRPTVVDRVSVSARLYPVGRLDLRSRGLILLTDDGELAVRLTHPRYHVEKEYRVLVAGRPSETALRQIREGMQVEGERFQPAAVSLVRASPTESTVTMVLHEGRKREIRRLWAALGHPVRDLLRTRIGPLHLARLPEGAQRPLTPAEVRALRRAAGLS